MIVSRLIQESKIAIDGSIVSEIGQYLGFMMWDRLTKEERKEVYTNDREDDYICGNVIDYKGIPMLIFRRQDRGHTIGYGRTTECTINLCTLKPTKNSSIQKSIPAHIVKKMQLMYKILAECANIREQYRNNETSFGVIKEISRLKRIAIGDNYNQNTVDEVIREINRLKNLIKRDGEFICKRSHLLPKFPMPAG
jgi:hypothetical protein